MRVGFDIDGTVDADPPVFLSLMEALRAAGHQVVVLSGCSEKHVHPKDVEEKKQYLRSLGMGNAYDKLVVFGDPPHKAKAKWIRKHKLDLYIDNSVANAQLADKYCTVLLPWASKTD